MMGSIIEDEEEESLGEKTTQPSFQFQITSEKEKEEEIKEKTPNIPLETLKKKRTEPAGDFVDDYDDFEGPNNPAKEEIVYYYGKGKEDSKEQ